MEATTNSSTHQWGSQYYEPAGLEVAPPESDLEYHNPPFQEKFVYGNRSSNAQIPIQLARNESIGLVPESGGNTKKLGFLPRTRRHRVICLFVGIALAAIIVGAAVGGTLATRKANTTRADPSPATSTSSPTSSPTSSSVPTASAPKTIKQNSPLAVSAFRKVNGVEIYFFFQGPDDVVYRSTYDSANAPVNGNSSLWQAPVAHTNHAAPTSPLCATTIVWDQYFEPLVGLYHFALPNYLLTGTNYNKQIDPTIQDDGIYGFNFTSSPSSRISCYWPYILYQDTNNMFVETRNDLDGFGTGTFSPSSEYSSRSLQVLGAKGSKVAVVPLSTIMNVTASKGGYGVVGQAKGGNLLAFIPDEQATRNVTRSWSAGANFPTINLREGASFAAFATARPNDSNNRTNTYVLYQAADGRIGMVWRDDESAWKTSQPDALANADNGTEIACLTMPESTRDAAGYIVPLETASTETRCYFQRGGAVREVQLQNGTDWVELGVVPIP